MQKTKLLSFLIPAMAGFFTMRAAEGGGGSTILDLDSMMDIEMGKVETLPDYVTPPEGNYALRVVEAKVEKYKQKAKDGQPERDSARIKLVYSVEKTIELTDNEIPVKDGSLFSDSFMATEEGIKYFKRQAMNIMNVENLDGATMKDVFDGLKDMNFNAKIAIRKTDDGKGGKFENVNVRPYHIPDAA